MRAAAPWRMTPQRPSLRLDRAVEVVVEDAVAAIAGDWHPLAYVCAETDSAQVDDDMTGGCKVAQDEFAVNTVQGLQPHAEKNGKKA